MTDGEIVDAITIVIGKALSDADMISEIADLIDKRNDGEVTVIN